MPPKEATTRTPTRKTPARGAKQGSTESGAYTRASQPSSQLARSPMQVSDGDSATQNAPTKPAQKPAGPIAAAMAKEKKVTDQDTPVAGPASDTTANDHPKQNQSKAKGKGKKGATSEDSDNESGRVKPRDRSMSARQAMLKEDRNHFIKIKRAKDRNDRKADTSAAAAQADDNDDHDKAADKQPKKAAPKTKAAAKKTKAADATVESDHDGQSANNDAPEDDTGNQPSNKAAPKKAVAPKKANAASKLRNHRERTYDDYKSASDGSDFDGVTKNSYSRLWDSVNRHAKWCPFVRINKKHHNSYRKVKKMEAQLAKLAYLMADSEGDDDNDDKPAPKTKKARAALKKTASKKSGQSKKKSPEVGGDQYSDAQSIIEVQDDVVDEAGDAASPEAESSSDNDRTGSGSEDSEEDISGEGESEGILDTKKATPKASSAKKDSSSKKTRTEASEADKVHDVGTSDSSDQDLSSLSPGKLAELQGAFNKDMAMKFNAETTDGASAEPPKASTAKSGAGRKRKAADAETTTQEPAKKTKKQRKSKDDIVLRLEDVLAI